MNLPQADVLYGFYLDGFSGQPSEPRPKSLEEKMAAALGAYDRSREKPSIEYRDSIEKRVADELAKKSAAASYADMPDIHVPRRF